MENKVHNIDYCYFLLKDKEVLDDIIYDSIRLKNGKIKYNKNSKFAPFAFPFFPWCLMLILSITLGTMFAAITGNIYIGIILYCGAGFLTLCLSYDMANRHEFCKNLFLKACTFFIGLLLTIWLSFPIIKKELSLMYRNYDVLYEKTEKSIKKLEKYNSVPTYIFTFKTTK